jgi:superfamily II DNA or RNA helicase
VYHTPWYSHGVKLFRPFAGWSKVIWGRDEQLAPGVLYALSALEAVPGVRRSPLSIEVPDTAQTLSQWSAFLEHAELQDYPAPRHVPPDHTLLAPLSLREHQRDAVDKLVDCGSGLLADDMGLGKTRTAIAAALTWQRIYQCPTVICGPKYVRNVWRRELVAVGAVQYEDEFYACESTTAELIPESARWVFCHYDVLHAWWPKLHMLRYTTVIFDEAHALRRKASRRSKYAQLVGGVAKHRVVLSGTPVENRISDLHPLLTIASGVGTWGAHSAFRIRYAGAQHDGYGLRDTEPTYVRELQRRMEPWYTRRLATEVLDLPPLTRTTLDTDVRAEMRELPTRDVLEGLVRGLTTGAFSARVLEFFARARKLSSTAKFKTTVEYLKSCAEQDTPTLVFAWQRETVERLAAESGGQAVTGAMTEAQRDEVITRYQRGEGAGVLVATYGTLREGVTLTRARVVILHDLELTLTHMLQAEKRIHRIGQNEACVSLWCVARGTVDELVYPILRRKAEALQALGDDVSHIDTQLGELANVLGGDTFATEVEASVRAWFGADQ